MLPSANSLTNLSKQLVRIIGPGLGALLVSSGDISLAFGINALSFTLSALGNLTQSGPVSVALPFLVSRHLHGDVGALGLVYSLFSLGSIAGAVWLGRVSSIDEFGSLLLVPIGFAVAGWATDQFGAQFVFVAGGLATSGLALLGLFHPAIRKLN